MVDVYSKLKFVVVWREKERVQPDRGYSPIRGPGRWNGSSEVLITAKIKKLPSGLLNEKGLRHIGYRNGADHLFPLFPPLFALS